MKSGNPWIASQRLENQHISFHPFEKPEEVVGWMGAIQAQNYRASLRATGLRIGDSFRVTEADIEQAIANRKIVRTWPMRGTLHFVAAEDIRWMLRLLTPRIIQGSAGRYRQLELDDGVFTQSRKVIEDALSGNKRLTRTEVYRVLEEAGILTEGQRGYHILNYLGQKGVICFGPQEGRQQTFVLLDEWVPAGNDLKGDEALAELTMRYFTSHGPATAHDFSWWSGLTLTDARSGIEMVTQDLYKEVIGDKIYWFSSSRSSAETSHASVFLLPAFDEYLLGYTDRDAVLDSSHAVKVYSRNGIFSPSIVMDGRVKGTWKQKAHKSHAVIHAHLFSKPEPDQSESIRKSAEKYGRFIGKEVEVTVTVAEPASSA